MTPGNDWPEFKRLVLDKLDQQHNDIEKMSERLLGVQLQLVALKVRAGLWGAVAGVIPVLAALLFRML